MIIATVQRYENAKKCYPHHTQVEIENGNETNLFWETTGSNSPNQLG